MRASLGRVGRLGWMKRLIGAVAAVYLLFAVIGRFVEGMGAARCGCDASCWCKTPGGSVFRWVFPFGHRAAPDLGGPVTDGMPTAGASVGSVRVVNNP